MLAPRVLLIDQAFTSGKLLYKYSRRVGWLNSVQLCSHPTETALPDSVDLTIACLPEPCEPIPDDLLNWLRHQPAVILTSAFPEHMYEHLHLRPIAFLTEPIAFNKFQNALQKYINSKS
ncbi:hypothetical protein [Spirosoma linguale]|uniref:Response regulator receiver protein n=1 Tax=Spirosoma linguale (strain ATCC 33905 / DSM 74 / LMG 10896 / Claus 1) TaxID=504472 RepID=D2QPN2_SPILD|nr:hypothetical protein Slin_4713 [Spirosoma linguale DSM 74]